MILETLIIAFLALVAVVALAEAGLRVRNPRRLWNSAFPEGSVLESHPTRGWAPRPHMDFDFHHRHLPGANRVRFNSLGMHDANEYIRRKPTECTRIALFGDTAAVGYEVTAHQTIASRLRQTLEERYPGRRFEVMNAAARNYCTAQLYHWYVEVVADYRPDLVLYLFGSNHPRRNVTAHEAGKSDMFHQPLLRLDDDGELRLVHVEPPDNPFDLIFLNDSGEIERLPGYTDNSFYRRIKNRSHLVTAVEDLFFSGTRQRRFRDRTEIKSMEKRRAVPEPAQNVETLPYPWPSTAAILNRWATETKARGAGFVVASFLTPYHADKGRLFADRNDHPLGFAFDEIPERRYLPMIADTAGFAYFDTYAHARARRVDTDPFYTHARYGYPTPEGAAFYGTALADAIEGHLTSGAGSPGTRERREPHGSALG